MANSSKVRIGTIENAGPNNLVSYLRNAGSVAKSIDIAVAFITAAGLDSLLYILQKTASCGQVRILTGLYQGFTDPKALRMLLREQQDSNGSFNVQISTDQHFHWKTYFLLGKRKANVIIGSSNMTDDGLNQSGEFNAVLTLDKSSKQFRDIHDVFERQWDSKAVPLTEQILQAYEKWRDANCESVKTPKIPLREILKQTRKPKVEPKQRSYWLYCLSSGYLSSETVELLQKTTDWESRGLKYISTWKPIFRPGDQAVLFDLNEDSVIVIEIKERTQTPQRTPDGFHFAAYRRVPRIPLRRLNKKRWKMLKSAGLIMRRSDLDQNQKLKPVQFEAFVANLKEKPK